MASIKEESTIEKVEKELQGFINDKATAETSLKNELAKAESEYDAIVGEIQSKYNVSEYEENIKRHTYFLRLLKGEIAIPDDLNAKKSRKTKSGKVSPEGERLPFPKSYEEAKNWKERILYVLTQINTGTNDDIIREIAKYDVAVNGKTVNLELSKLLGSGNVSKSGKDGKRIIYGLPK